ncbi:MAG: transglutaminase-like domain-containing protein [Promethearchaeota archaeon]
MNKEDLEKYLKPNEFFDFDKKRVLNTALEITKGLKSQKEKAIALFYFVRDEIKYNMMSYIPQLRANFKASVTLRRKNGFCVSKAILLSTLARAVGIPARIHLVDIINHKIPEKVVKFMGTKAFHYHGYSELYLNEKWVKLTPAFDKKTAIKGGFLPMCEFDGEHDAMFPKYDKDGNLFVEYIEDRGIHDNLPLEDIQKVFEEKYGSIFSGGLDLGKFQGKALTYKD